MPTAAIGPEASLLELASELVCVGVGAQAVMDGERFNGLVSERHVVRSLAIGPDAADVRDADVLVNDPITLDADTTVAEAAAPILDDAVRHLPVVVEDDVVGVSIRDVLQVYASEPCDAAGVD